MTSDTRPDSTPKPMPKLICGFAGLALFLALLIYLPVRHFAFLNFDDPVYLEHNPWLAHGLNWASLHWAFTANLIEHSPNAEYWEPLTLLSRLFDAQIYGIQAGPFHVTSAVLHFLNALALCAALYRLTNQWGRSAVVALLFLVHPLSVEPACWLSARKDLLSGTFFFATLWAYGYYTSQPSAKRYRLLVLTYCAALMAKPMAVSIPFVLLILDGWPLGRWGKAFGNRKEQRHLLVEKIPLFILAGIGALLAVVSQQDIGAMQTSTSLSLPLRVENALVSYAVYVRRIFWPNDLTIYYPHPGPFLPLWKAVVAALFLVAVTVAALRLWRRAPFLLSGWLWFGIVLGPVIGLVQIGGQAMADRYAYPSAIGIFVMAVWGAAECLRQSQASRAVLAGACIASLTLVSMRQVTFWRDSEAAFSRAVAVTQNNGLAYLDLGSALLAKQEFARARENYFKAVGIMPFVSMAWQDLGTSEAALGHDDIALEDLAHALTLDPNNSKSMLGIARILIKQGKKDEAIPLLRQVVRLESLWPEPYYSIARIYTEEGRKGEAEVIWTVYLEIHPNDETAARALKALNADN